MLRTKTLVDDAALNPALTVILTGTVPSWYESMSLGKEVVDVFRHYLEPEGNRCVDLVRAS